LIVVGNTKRPAFRIWNGHFVSDGAGLFGALAPMLWIVDGNFWLLLLLLLLPLLLQPPFGTSRQFLIVVGNTKRPAFRIWNGHFVSDGAGLFGALAPIFRFIDRDFGHWVCSSNRSWLDRALGGFQLFANQAAGHLDCRHHVAEMMAAADQRVADLDDSLGFGCRIMLKLMGNPAARALGKRSGCRIAAR